MMNNPSEEFDTATHSKNKLILFFLILIIVGVAIGCFFSPVFNLSRIDVLEGVNVSKEEVYQLVDAQKGENVFQIDYHTLKSQIEQLPYVQLATVKLKLPNTIYVSYIERTPTALIKYLESFMVMDQYGYLLEITREKKYSDLPIIYNIEINSYEIGKQLSDTAKTKYDNVMYLLENAKQHGFPYTISEINYESIGNVKIYVEGEDIEIIYGEINRNSISEKLKYITGILSTVQGKKGKLDVSSERYLEKTVFTERY